MESELVTVRRITLSKADIDEAIKAYIEAYHGPPLSLRDDYNMRPIFQAGMLAGHKLVLTES